MPADTQWMEGSLRPLRMASSVASLLVALFSLEGTYELVTATLLPLVKYGNEFTAYGWGVIAAIAARVAITGALFWAFARFRSSKPLPFSGASQADAPHLSKTLVTASPATSDR
jgi:hypothetical protein